MQLLNALTINEEPENEEDLLEIIWEALEYFPKGMWEGIKYLGNINVEHDLKIKSEKKVFGAFIFNILLSKIKEMKNVLKIDYLLLAVTRDPVIAIYYRFEWERFKRVINLIHDYVSRDVGIISLFNADEEDVIKIAAHGLGHSKGLKHHAKPIDLMYERLLDRDPLKRVGFCDTCQQKLKDEKVV